MVKWKAIMIQFDRLKCNIELCQDCICILKTGFQSHHSA